MTTTRERLIEAAAELFYRNGFQAVGMDQVLREVGITKTAFYKHFDGKDALIIAVLKHRDSKDIAESLQYMQSRGGSDPRDQILAFFDQLDEWFRDPGFRGCLFMNAATEFPSQNDPIHQTAIAHAAHLAGELWRLLAQLGVPDPTAIARQIMLLVAGAISARHVQGMVDAAVPAKQVVEALLPRRAPEAPQAARTAKAR